MAAEALPKAKIPHVPLQCAIVENPKRLSNILNEVTGWTLLAKDSKDPELSIFYANIASRIASIVDAKLVLFDPATGKSEDAYVIIAAYDQKGNLQGIETAIFDKTGGAEIDCMVTAIWNKEHHPAYESHYTKGVGTCLLNRTVELMRAPGPICLKAIKSSMKFFEGHGFFRCNIFDFSEATPMKLIELGFSAVAKKSKGQLQSCKEQALPAPRENFVELLKAKGQYQT